MLEIKFGHELNVQRYTWHARLLNNAIHNNVTCITQNFWYHDIFTQKKLLPNDLKNLLLRESTVNAVYPVYVYVYNYLCKIINSIEFYL